MIQLLGITTSCHLEQVDILFVKYKKELAYMYCMDFKVLKLNSTI